MGKRKEYTFHATIKSRDKTEHDEKVKNEAMDIYIEHLLKIYKKQNPNTKLVN